jgi:radical SAM superfamily enzyme YgiQ (UPF0313 family)
MNRGRILLLTPNLKGVRDGLNRIQPPLGPMIAAEVMRRRGHEVCIHDAALEGWHNQVVLDEKTILIGQPDSEIEEVIAEYSPDIIGISALFTNLMDSAHRMARLAKNVCPEANVILGGNHISNAIAGYVTARRSPHADMPPRLPDLEDENIDFTMRGEVDLEFPRLVDALINGSDTSEIPGLVTRSGRRGDYVINPAPPPLSDLDELPTAARDLVNMERYFDIGAFHSAKSKSKRVLSVMASRGCPEKCTFCTTPEMWGSIEEPNEAMAGRGPDGRMVPTFTWGTLQLTNR